MYLKRLCTAAFVGLSFVSSMVVTGNAFAQLSPSSTQSARITQAVDEANRVTLKSNTLSLTKAFPDRGAAPQSMATGRILLVLQRSAAQEESLKSYLTSLQSASSPSYRHWLTPAQFGATYGVGDADLQTIELWLQSHGFKVEKVQQARNAIEFSASWRLCSTHPSIRLRCMARPTLRTQAIQAFPLRWCRWYAALRR